MRVAILLAFALSATSADAARFDPRLSPMADSLDGAATQLEDVARELGAYARAVTVDPERDSVAHMRDYLAAFDPTFIGATGDPQALAEVREDYGVTAVREGTGPDYAMAHTSSIFLIDREGRLRAMMPFGHDAADFAHDVEFLLGRGGCSRSTRSICRARSVSSKAAVLVSSSKSVSPRP